MWSCLGLDIDINYVKLKGLIWVLKVRNFNGEILFLLDIIISKVINLFSCDWYVILLWGCDVLDWRGVVCVFYFCVDCGLLRWSFLLIFVEFSWVYLELLCMYVGYVVFIFVFLFENCLVLFWYRIM